MGFVQDRQATENTWMSAELRVLYRLQYEALQKSSYLRMSEKEAEVYDRRRVRIGELCDKLTKLREAVL